MLALSAGKVSRLLLWCILFLITAFLVTQTIRIALGHNFLMGLTPLFHLDWEANLPAWYSSVSLLVAASLAAVIALSIRKSGQSSAGYWFGIALIFTFLSADEAAGMHELLAIPFRTLLNAKGFLFFTWVVPAAGALLILTLIYARWFFRLPSFMRRLSAAAAIVYLGGAIGMELIGGFLAERSGFETPQYMLVMTIEETMEMSGVVIWIYALLRYAESVGAEITLSFRPSAEGSSAASTTLVSTIGGSTERELLRSQPMSYPPVSDRV